MNLKTIVYIDDRLDGNLTHFEVVTLHRLRDELGGDFNVVGLDPQQALEYFEEAKISPDLIICDHNLWWNKNEDDSYEYGYQLISRLQEMHHELPPVIIFSDSISPGIEWERAGVEHERFVPKKRGELDKLVRAVYEYINV